MTKKLQTLLKNFPCVVVSGARQVGKSTLLRHLFEATHDFVVFDPVIDIENARQDPELFLANHKLPIVLDEIQYAPELVSVIKRKIDLDRLPGQYILTGSQQWQVLKNISESLAGRVAFIDLDAFCLTEVAGVVPQKEGSWLSDWLQGKHKAVQNRKRLDLKRSLYETLWTGFLPETQVLDPEVIPDFFAAYQRTYVERDIRLIADISDWQEFGRFLRLMSALSAQEINYSQIGRDISITPQTAQRWLNLLSATF